MMTSNEPSDNNTVQGASNTAANVTAKELPALHLTHGDSLAAVQQAETDKFQCVRCRNVCLRCYRSQLFDRANREFCQP